MKRNTLLPGLALAVGLAIVPHCYGVAQEESEDETDPISVSGSATLVSDYRFRGVSLSSENVAIQGAMTVSTDIGFYAGFWGSSIETFTNPPPALLPDEITGAEAEIDVVFGYSTSFDALSLNVGTTYFHFPGGIDVDYWEPYLNLGYGSGPLSASVLVAYAPDQDDIGGEDNIYLNGGLSYALESMPIPLSFSASLGYEDGAFGDDKLDWSLGVSATVYGVDLGVSYVDTDIDGDLTDATVIGSIGVSF